MEQLIPPELILQPWKRKQIPEIASCWV